MIFQMPSDDLLNEVKIALVNKMIFYDWEVEKCDPVNRLISVYCDHQQISEGFVRTTPIHSNLIPAEMNYLPIPLSRKKDVQWFLLQNLKTKDIHFGVC